MELNPGTRLKSAVCEAEIVVVRKPSRSIELCCGGQPMFLFSETRPADAPIAADFAGGSQIGKRYFDEGSGLEVLCSRGGKGSLSVEGRLLTIKDVKRLPSSD